MSVVPSIVAVELLREAAELIERGDSPEGRVRWEATADPPWITVRFGAYLVVNDTSIVGERRVVEVVEDFREDWT